MHVRNKDLGHVSHLERTLHELVLRPFSRIYHPATSARARQQGSLTVREREMRTHMALSSLIASEDTFRVEQGRPAAVPRKVTLTEFVCCDMRGSGSRGGGREEGEERRSGSSAGRDSSGIREQGVG